MLCPAGRWVLACGWIRRSWVEESLGLSRSEAPGQVGFPSLDSSQRDTLWGRPTRQMALGRSMVKVWLIYPS